MQSFVANPQTGKEQTISSSLNVKGRMNKPIIPLHLVAASTVCNGSEPFLPTSENLASVRVSKWQDIKASISNNASLFARTIDWLRQSPSTSDFESDSERPPHTLAKGSSPRLPFFLPVVIDPKPLQFFRLPLNTLVNSLKEHQRVDPTDICEARAEIKQSYQIPAAVPITCSTFMASPICTQESLTIQANFTDNDPKIFERSQSLHSPHQDADSSEDSEQQEKTASSSSQHSPSHILGPRGKTLHNPLNNIHQRLSSTPFPITTPGQPRSSNRPNPPTIFKHPLTPGKASGSSKCDTKHGTIHSTAAKSPYQTKKPTHIHVNVRQPDTSESSSVKSQPHFQSTAFSHTITA
ncbi:hypothetical protein OUZ56_012210 [Daphnia magna]|uniref:Uncharacterized protein n=1 Tax=Daphnia magna TaxID=35525 RepID=A0ABQ9Z2B9_9CRUS|nr:hypothetical protein OUZ56_012210 [Daphnia magna]